MVAGNPQDNRVRSVVRNATVKTDIFSGQAVLDQRIGMRKVVKPLPRRRFGSIGKANWSKGSPVSGNSLAKLDTLARNYP